MLSRHCHCHALTGVDPVPLALCRQHGAPTLGRVAASGPPPQRPSVLKTRFDPYELYNPYEIWCTALLVIHNVIIKQKSNRSHSLIRVASLSQLVFKGRIVAAFLTPGPYDGPRTRATKT